MTSPHSLDIKAAQTLCAFSVQASGLYVCSLGIKARNEKTAPFGVRLLSSHLLYQAPQMVIKAIHPRSKVCRHLDHLDAAQDAKAAAANARSQLDQASGEVSALQQELQALQGRLTSQAADQQAS